MCCFQLTLGVGVNVLRRGFSWAEPHELGEPGRPQVESKPVRAKETLRLARMM